jgi:hypothetical protein
MLKNPESPYWGELSKKQSANLLELSSPAAKRRVEDAAKFREGLRKINEWFQRLKPSNRLEASIQENFAAPTTSCCGPVTTA